MNGIMFRQLIALVVITGLAQAQLPQQPPGSPAAQPPSAATPQQQDLGLQFQQLRPNYVLRPGDQILIRAFEVEEISERPFRVDGDGFINIPILGRIKASGSTVETLEANLIEQLKKYVKQPQVTITVVQFSSEPVFFVGAFKAPGIYPLGGRRTLIEMMASIGGLQPTASRRIKVTRRKEYGAIPLANAVRAPDGSGSSVEINMASLRDNLNPAEDILLQPFDVVSVERAEMVYVLGEVGHVGAFDLQEKDSISVIQAIVMAGGLTQSANSKNVIILRPVTNTSRRAEIPVDLQRILKGEDRDRPLLPNDVMYIPKVGVFSSKNAGRIALIALPTTIALLSLGVTLSR
jgi:polysaccharide biosynthesis/export protein